MSQGIQIKSVAEFKLAQKLRAKLVTRLLDTHNASLVVAELVQSSLAVDELINGFTVLHKQIKIIDDACNAWLYRSFDDVKHADGDETMDVEGSLRNALCEHRRRRNRRPEQEFDENANPISTIGKPYGTPTTPWSETGWPGIRGAG